jgi:hypothetical protein
LQYGTTSDYFHYSDNDWIIDSGTTDHITCDKENYKDMKTPLWPISVGLPNNNRTRVEGIYRISLNDKLILNKVNFLSVRALWMILIVLSSSLLKIMSFKTL